VSVTTFSELTEMFCLCLLLSVFIVQRKLVLEVNHLGKQWFMQSFEDKMIDLILKKIYKLRGKI
jgi:hypothetical protein